MLKVCACKGTSYINFIVLSLIINSKECNFAFQNYQIASLNKDRNLVYSFDWDSQSSSSDDWCKVDAVKNLKFEGGSNSPFLTPQYITKNFIDVKYAEGNYENVNCWQILYVARRKIIGNVSNGFHGRLYFDAGRMQLMLVLDNDKILRKLKHFNKDYQCSLLQIGGTIDSAFTFAERVRLFISEFKCKPQLFVAGESLAGFLAQIIAFAVKFCSIDECGKVWFSHEQGLRSNPRALVFNSPSAQQIISRFANNDSGEVYAQLDVNNFNLGSKRASEEGKRLLNESDDEVDTAGASGMQSKLLESQRTIAKSSFLPEELQALQVLPLYALLHKDMEMDIPAFTIEKHGVTICNHVSPEEFIPRVRALVEKKRTEFQNASVLVQQKFNNLILSQRKILVDRFDNVGLKLSEEVLNVVNGWCSGTKIFGLEKDADKVLFAHLLQNSIPNLFYLSESDFKKLTLKNCSFNGVLVIIDDNQQQYSKHQNTDFDQIPQTRAKILNLVSKQPVGTDICQVAPHLKHLDQVSQCTLRKTKLQIMGNEMEAEELFGELKADFTISEILSFKCNNKTDDVSGEQGFYFDQQICSENKSFNGTVDRLSNNYQPHEFILITGTPGVGKSVALKRIMAVLKKRLPHYFIMLFNLSTIEDYIGCSMILDDICNILVQIFVQEKSASLVGNLTVLKKLIGHKLEAKEAIFLIDDLDRVETMKKERVKKFFQILSVRNIGVIGSANSKTSFGSDFFAFNRAFSLKPIPQKERCDFVAKYVHHSLKHVNEESICKICHDALEEELWGTPLHLILIAESPKLEMQSSICPFKLLIAGATRKALMDVEEEKYPELSRIVLNLVCRLANCVIFNKRKFSPTELFKGDKDITYLRKFRLLSMNETLQTVSFTHARIAEYLVADALVRAFRKDPYVDKTDFNNERLFKVFTAGEFLHVRFHMNSILQCDGLEVNKLQNVNGELQKLKLILLALIKENKFLLLYKLLEACHKIINYKQLWDGPLSSRAKESPLYLALEQANEDFVSHLVQKGATLETIPIEKLYTLHWAVKFPSLNNAVKNGFNKFTNKLIVRCENKTPVAYATVSGNTEMVEFLIKKEADVNTKSRQKIGLK
jgi:nucleoside-triphosphatase THEP1